VREERRRPHPGRKLKTKRILPPSTSRPNRLGWGERSARDLPRMGGEAKEKRRKTKKRLRGTRDNARPNLKPTSNSRTKQVCNVAPTNQRQASPVRGKNREKIGGLNTTTARNFIGGFQGDRSSPAGPLIETRDARHEESEEKAESGEKCASARSIRPLTHKKYLLSRDVLRGSSSVGKKGLEGGTGKSEKKKSGVGTVAAAARMGSRIQGITHRLLSASGKGLYPYKLIIIPPVRSIGRRLGGEGQMAREGKGGDRREGGGARRHRAAKSKFCT